jgi:CDP-diacylglycerol pyrophosphatase
VHAVARPVNRAVAVVLAGALTPAFGPVHALSGALWQIVHEQCVVHTHAHESPAPCTEVVMEGPDAVAAENSGYAILKDRRGKVQFLLIPTRRLLGIEDPVLLRDDTPLYWQKAWVSLHFIDELRGDPVPREDLSLAINSVWSRSEDQMHIHLSCVRDDLRGRLLASQSQIGESWSLLEGGWVGHALWVRRFIAEDLSGIDPFRDVAAHVPNARESMDRFGIAVVPFRFSGGHNGFVLIADPVDLALGGLGSAERDVQDHDCAVLH